MSKRKPMEAVTAADLDPEAFSHVAVAQPDPVQVATAPRTPPVTAQPTRPKSTAAQRTAIASPPSRVGKVQIVAWVTPEIRVRLKRKALDVGRPVDEILNALIADFLKKG
jgi:hypothetical protein